MSPLSWLNPFSSESSNSYSKVGDARDDIDESTHSPNNVSTYATLTHPRTPKRTVRNANKNNNTSFGEPFDDEEDEQGGRSSKVNKSFAGEDDDELKKPRSERVALGVMYGLINAAVVLPVMMVGIFEKIWCRRETNRT
jgi:hypothetical protein